MQVVADILDKNIKVTKSEQACALGAAMFAATAGNVYNTVEQAQSSMESGFETVYTPDKKNAEKYKKLYKAYSVLGEFIESQTQKDSANE